jgi:hypothetical protein
MFESIRLGSLGSLLIVLRGQGCSASANAARSLKPSVRCNRYLATAACSVVAAESFVSPHGLRRLGRGTPQQTVVIIGGQTVTAIITATIIITTIVLTLFVFFLLLFHSPRWFDQFEPDSAPPAFCATILTGVWADREWADAVAKIRYSMDNRARRLLLCLEIDA